MLSGGILAYDPPLIVSAPAAGVLALIAWTFVRWMLTRSTHADAATEARVAALDAAIEVRIAALESKVEQLEHDLEKQREETSKERHDKHEALSKAAAYHGTLKVVQRVVTISEPEDIKRLLVPLLDEVE